MAQISISVAPPVRSTRAHSATVLPVVTTSSINAIRAPGSGAAERERAQRIGLALAGVQLNLRASVTNSPQAVDPQRNPAAAGSGARQFQGLIETAFAQATRMQRHRRDAIRQRTATFGQRGDEQFAQQPGAGQTSAEFQARNQKIHRWLIAKRYERAVEVRGLRPAARADAGPAERQRRSAARASREIARQVAQAAGAQVQSRRARRAAQQTGRR